MHVDYEGLYAVDYFGHQEGAASFPEHFPEAFASIIRGVDGQLVLDVGAGNNGLLGRLASLGLDGLALDLRGDDARSVLAFDLTRDDPSATSAVHDRIAGRSHVTCCLDVLEHLDRKDIATAIWNLRELAAEWLLVSVSTRPSSRYNLYHSLILPKRSWRSIFREAGFQIEDHERLADLASYREYPDDENCWSVNQWRKVDPFRDARDPESYYVLLRKTRDPVDRDAFREATAKIVGEPLAPVRVPLDPDTHLVFLLGHYQDFLHYLPYWEALPREAFTVLATHDAFDVIGHRRGQAITAWMRCRGIRVHPVRSTSDFDWDALPSSRTAFLAASESSASPSHMLSQAMVVEARSRGLRTFQIQHGIWPRAAFPRPVAFLSEFVIAWSDEFRQGFAPHACPPSENSIAAEPPVPAILGASEFLIAGCAKFDDYEGAPEVDLEDVLGEWVAPFAKRVFVATNLHWPLHHRGEEVMPQLIATATAMPETLFVCKLHPVEDLESFAGLAIPPNLVILDEYACLFAGLKTSQLLLGCDAVVCTPSTVALEAALAGRPFAILDTDNPTQYEGVAPIPIASLTVAVRELLASNVRPDSRAFRDRYYDVANLGRSRETVFATIRDKLRLPIEPSAQIPIATMQAFTSTYADYMMAVEPARLLGIHREAEALRDRVASLTTQVEGAGAAHMSLIPVLHESQIRIADLTAQVADLTSQAASLADQVAARDRELAELRECQVAGEAVKSRLATVEEENGHLWNRVNRAESSLRARVGASARTGRLAREYPRLSAILKAITKN